MSPPQLEELTKLVAPYILQDDACRETIPPQECLCVTLRYLASGNSHVALAGYYRISPTSFSRLIPKTCDTLWQALQGIGLIEVPQNEEEWKRIALEFENRVNFSNCLGAMDGKHITISSSANSGSMFFTYKKTFSLVLLAICSTNYKFLMVDIGEAGRQSDAGVFADSNVGHVILSILLRKILKLNLQNSSSHIEYTLLKMF